MKYEDLIRACVECINTYNPAIEGPDNFADNFLKQKTKDSNERMFIRQIFYGVLRYKDFLKFFTENLFTMNKSSTERKDDTLFQILCYITVFRLDELNHDDYKSLILSQDTVKMNEFFKFLGDPSILENVLRPGWVKILDYIFVDEKLLANLKKNFEVYNDLITAIRNRASVGVLEDASTSRKSRPSSDLVHKKATIPEPFNLSVPKPRKILEPIAIPVKVEITPMLPYEEYNKVTLAKLEEKRKERLEVIKKNTLKKFEGGRFELATEKRPTNLEKIEKEVKEKESKLYEFNKKFGKEIPDFSKIPAEITYNTAAILKEDYLIQQKKAEEMKNLERIMVEKKDSSEFERWRSEMNEKDNILKNEMIIKRKIALELAREEVVNNLETRKMNNLKKAMIHKEEEMRNMAEKHQSLKEEIEKKRILVNEIKKEERENYKLEKERQNKENRENYLKYQNEVKDTMLKKKEEKRYEDEKRKEIINQIRQLERIPVARTKGFDPTETAGIGLLEEMSLVELKERLEQQKRITKEYTQCKKQENRIKTNEKIDDLLEKAKMISNERDKLRNQKEIERKNKKLSKEAELKRIQDLKEESLFELKNKIETKKKNKKREEDEFEQKIREIKLQRQYLQQGRAVVESKAYKMIEDGIERKMNNKQNQDLIDQQQNEAVKFREIQIRYQRAKEEVREKTNLQDNYSSTLAVLKGLRNQTVQEDDAYKKIMYERQKNLEKINKEKQSEMNKFSEKLSQNSTCTKEKSDSYPEKIEEMELNWEYYSKYAALNPDERNYYSVHRSQNRSKSGSKERKRMKTKSRSKEKSFEDAKSSKIPKIAVMEN